MHLFTPKHIPPSPRQTYVAPPPPLSLFRAPINPDAHPSAAAAVQIFALSSAVSWITLQRCSSQCIVQVQRLIFILKNNHLLLRFFNQVWKFLFSSHPSCLWNADIFIILLCLHVGRTLEAVWSRQWHFVLRQHIPAPALCPLFFSATFAKYWK